MFLFISSLNCCKLLVNLELPAYAEDVPSSNVFKAFFTCAELLLKVAKPVCKLSLPASNLVVPIFKVTTPDCNDLVPAWTWVKADFKLVIPDVICPNDAEPCANCWVPAYKLFEPAFKALPEFSNFVAPVVIFEFDAVNWALPAFIWEPAVASSWAPLLSIIACAVTANFCTLGSELVFNLANSVNNPDIWVFELFTESM